MDIPTHSDLLSRIELFCRRHEMAESRFGREAVNNPAFVSSLRRDPPVSPTLDTLNKLRDYMSRKDEEARAAEFCSVPSNSACAESGEEAQLPFGPAPVTSTGASSPTSSPTTAPPQLPGASDTSPTSSCSDAEAA